ncbi:hypothetical protein ABEB36_001476 [Hypothenemus hampei]|uniref:Sodefrin-like factor n=1 Tax=Hypothenemus hampei TaxID=57062 RepID=A0ABD1FFK9_HYPHA
MYESKSFAIIFVGLITVAFLQIDSAYGIKCYQCNSTQDGCGKTLDESLFDPTECKSDTTCVTYISQDQNAKSKIIYTRACGSDYDCSTNELYCETCSTESEAGDDNAETNDISGDGCNKNVLTNFCIECSDEECSDDDVSSNESLDICALKSDEQCFTYRTQSDFSAVTKRGCGSKDYCKDLDSDPTTLYCSTCSNDDKCNSKMDEDQKKIVCISCEDDDTGTACASEEITDFSGITSTIIDKGEINQYECISKKYFEGGQSHMHRGKEEKDYCSNQKDDVEICDSCSTDYCNKKINENASRYNVCVQCDNGNCTENNMSSENITDYCHLQENEVCVTFQSLKNGTKRGCQRMGKCIEMYDENQSDLQFCTECSEGQLCNKVVDTSKTCYSCNDETDENCSEELNEDKDKPKTCILDSVKNECFVYQYKKENKTITARECATVKLNCENLGINAGINDLLMCNMCNSSNCNSDIHTVDNRTACIQCSSEDGGECDKADTTEEIGKCFLDDAVNKNCIAYRYVDETTATYKIYRGCDKNTCNDDNKILTTDCLSCSDNDDCTSQLSTATSKKLCIDCDESDEKCGEQILTQVTKVCELDGDKQCVTHKYLDGADVKAVRGCLAKNYCNVTAPVNSSSTLCVSCDGEICNKEYNVTEKTLCAKCSGDGCPEKLDAAKVPSYCALDGSTECITYKYRDSSTEKDIIVRDCVKKDSESCDAKLKDDSLGGSLKSCLTCSDSNLCNLKTNSTEINGASSMITLNTAVVPLIVMIVAKVVV